MARKDSNWMHILFIVLLYAVTVSALCAFLAWNKVDTPFAYEFLQRIGLSGVDGLSDAGVRDLWFSEMLKVYAVVSGLSVLLVGIWNLIFRKAGSPARRSLENLLFAVFLALHLLMTLLVGLLSGILGFASSMTLDAYDVLAYYGLFLLNIPFVLSLWLFSPVGMRSALFKKW